jgi:hypothetical protein
VERVALNTLAEYPRNLSGLMFVTSAIVFGIGSEKPIHRYKQTHGLTKKPYACRSHDLNFAADTAAHRVVVLVK